MHSLICLTVHVAMMSQHQQHPWPGRATWHQLSRLQQQAPTVAQTHSCCMRHGALLLSTARFATLGTDSRYQWTVVQQQHRQHAMIWHRLC